MSNISKRTVSLPEEHGAYIDQMVASGAFASASEVVRAGLRALQEREAAVDRWLRGEVVPVYVAMQQILIGAFQHHRCLTSYVNTMRNIGRRTLEAIPGYLCAGSQR